MRFVTWENLRMRKIVRVPAEYNGEMVAKMYGGNAEDWEIVVVKG